MKTTIKNRQNNNYYKDFPTRLRELLRENKMTIDEFGKKINKARSTAGYYCDGSITPDVDTLHNIAMVFGVSTDWLLGLSDVNDVSNKTEDTLSFISSRTGLSRTAIDNMVLMLDRQREYFEKNDAGLPMQVLSSLLEHDDFWKIINNICLLKSDVKREKYKIESMTDGLNDDESPLRYFAFQSSEVDLNKAVITMYFNSLVNDITKGSD